LFTTTKVRNGAALHSLMVDRKVFVVLMAVDQQLADAARAQRCPHCDGPLHQRNYHRKPRGGGCADAGEAFTLRLGLCCGKPRCRKSLLPPSVRFLGRRVYLELAMLMACWFAIVSSSAPSTCVPTRTVRRWLVWWTTRFTVLPTWRVICGCMPGIDDKLLPHSFIERVAQGHSVDEWPLLAARWLAPLTTRSLPSVLDFCGTIGSTAFTQKLV
jgi:hypothetical protein